MKRWRPAYTRFASSLLTGVAVGIVIVLGFAAFVLTPGGSLQPADQPPANQPEPEPEPIGPFTTADPVPAGGERRPAIVPGSSPRDAQDFYLAILLEDPENQGALAALAVVRRQMAAGDPAVLRAQTRAFREAISRGIESDERYSIRAMRLLVRAGALAISQIEAEQRAQRAAAPPAALPAPAAEPPRSLAKPAPPRSVVVQAPPSSAVGQAPAPLIAPKHRSRARPVVLRSAPTISAQPVAEVERERLARSAKTTARAAPPLPLFRVLSQPMRAAVANRRAAAFTARGFRPVVRPVPGGMARLQFGVFVSRHNAENLAARIRTQGFPVIIGTAAPAVRAPLASETAGPAPAMRRATDFETLMREGYALYRAGWYGPSVSRFRTASAVAPHSPRAQLWLGRAAIKAVRLSEARRALQRVIHLAPTSDAAREAQTMLARLD